MTAPIEKMTKEELLNRFQSKAGCMHTQEEASRVWMWLRRYLTDEQAYELFQGWNHHEMCRDGRRELDVTCNEIRMNWAGVEKIQI